MKKCIICAKEKDDREFSLEHIIPYSIGNNSLTITCVCKNCNSKMGELIDCETTNNPIASLFRDTHNIIGKAKKKKPFLSGTFRDTEGNVYQVDDNLIPKRVNNEVRIEGDQIKLSGGNADELIRIANAKLIACGNAPLSKAQQDEIKQSSKKFFPQLSKESTLDLTKLWMETIKIAYEFFAYRGYNVLEYAEIRKLGKYILQYINTKECSFIDNVVGYPPKDMLMEIDTLRDCFKNNHSDKACHIISVVNYENCGCIVLVLLDGNLAFGVKVSDNMLEDIKSETLMIGYPSGIIATI